MRLIVALTMVCVIAAFILGVVYKNTAPLIAAQKQNQIEQALKQIIPAADEFQKHELKSSEYYQAYKNKKLLGYIIFAEAEGYAAPIDMMVGIDKRGSIEGIEILGQQETPGLGARCVEIKYGEKKPWFLEQFKGMELSGLNLYNIDAITGATITTKAIIRGIKQNIEDFLAEVK